MVPADFAESNLVLDIPPQMTQEECEPLCVFRGELSSEKPVLISCFKVTAEELEEIRRTGRVWLTVFGTLMPPVALSSSKPIHST